MIFSNPLLLWTALGALIPLAIHLWSRKREIIIKIGSIKLLKKFEPARSSSLRPNEWWLLLLRMLTVVMLACILAGPHWNTPVKNIPLTYIVEPALLRAQNMQKIWDTLPADATRVFAEGLPEITDYDLSTSDTIPPNYWQLAQDMARLPSDSIVVFTKALVSGIHGMRPRTDKTIHFVTLVGDNNLKQTVEVGQKSDSVQALSLVNDGMRLRFEKKMLSRKNGKIKINAAKDSITLEGQQLPLQPNKSMKVLLVYVDSLDEERYYIQAAYRAISTYLDKKITVDVVQDTDSVSPASYDFSVWLGINPLETNKPYLKYMPDALANGLIVPGEKSNEHLLIASLNSENIVSEYLADKLLMLLPLHKNLEKEITRFDGRSMADVDFRPESVTMDTTSKPTIRMDLSPWLWGFLISLLIAERLLAKIRKQ